LTQATLGAPTERLLASQSTDRENRRYDPPVVRQLSVIAVVIVALAAASAASASRPATNTEQAQIYKAAQRFGDNFEVGGSYHQIAIVSLRLRVSTINSRWVAATVSFHIDGLLHTGEPALFYRTRPAHWAIVRFGAYNDDCAFTLPARISRELRIVGPCQ
jgi:hypothetical protein